MLKLGCTSEILKCIWYFARFALTLYLKLGMFMNKREYTQANKDWLEAKSKEEGVKALPKGIYYKVLSEGDQWELYIPAEMGYGKFFAGQSGKAERSQPGIPGGSTLIFEIELLGIA